MTDSLQPAQTPGDPHMPTEDDGIAGMIAQIAQTLEQSAAPSVAQPTPPMPLPDPVVEQQEEDEFGF